MTVEQFMKEDRQWLRSSRIAHAKYQLKLAKKSKIEENIKFWERVVVANGTIVNPPPQYWVPSSELSS